MTLPAIYNVSIITLSDRASKGEYNDLSGRNIEEAVITFFNDTGKQYRIERILIPDDAVKLRQKVLKASHDSELIFTTGGTGIGARDITVETIRPLLDKEIPGVMEFIRVKYGFENPNALLSRGVAGIIGKCLIYTLPGSMKAVDEYMNEILKTLDHTIYMLYGIDTHKH
jgi:molybdopterin adenylyltransferase